MSQIIDKQDPLIKQLQEYKRTNKMKTLGSFEDLVGVVEGRPVVAGVKVDGEATILSWDGHSAKTVSLEGRIRRDLPLTDEVERLLRGKGESIFVVELYGVDERGDELPYPKAISLLRKPRDEGDEKRIRAAALDVLRYDGKDLTSVSYWKRLTIATNIFGNGTYISPVYATEDGESTVERLWEQQVLTEGHEGLVVRTDDIYKIKPVNTLDLAVIGVERSKGHPELVGALLLAFMDEEGNFLDAGKVGSGLTQKDREDWIEWAGQYKVAERGRNIYVDPLKGDRVVEIRYEGLNPTSRPAWRFEAGEFAPVGEFRSTALRHPVLVRIRDDKHVEPEDVRIKQLPVHGIRLAKDRGGPITLPPENYYKGADAANYLITRLILEKAQEEFGFLESFFDQYGVARGYANYHNIDPKFAAYLPEAMDQVIRARKVGMGPLAEDQRQLLGEWKEFWGDPLLTDEDIDAFFERYFGERPTAREGQKELAEWDELLDKWAEHYQDMLYATWSTPEYREALYYQYSPKELSRAEKDPSVESKTIWEEYYDDIMEDDQSYIFDKLVAFYENSPSAGLGFAHSFGSDTRGNLLDDLADHYGVSGLSELHDYTSEHLPMSEQGREFYRWYLRNRKDLEDKMEEIPSLPLTLLVQDITGEEYEVPLAKVEETQNLFVELEDDLRKALAPELGFGMPPTPTWVEPKKAAIIYVRSDSPLWERAEDLEALLYRREFGGGPGKPGSVIYLEVPEMEEDFQVITTSPAAIEQLRKEYIGNRCICPTDGRTFPRTEERCELQECSEHPGMFLESAGPTIFGDIRDKLEEMFEAGERLYKPEEVDKALEEVENAVTGAEPNAIVYYATDGPLAQEAKVRGGLGILEMYKGYVLFLPSTDVTRGFEIVDSIPDELFVKLQGAVNAGYTSGLPSLEQLRERGRFVSYHPDEVTEEVMSVDDVLDYAVPNIIVYYTMSGPLGWGISTQSEEISPLGLYGEDILFLPTNELSKGFEVIDGVPDELFAQVKQSHPSLSELREQGLGPNRERAEEQFRGLIDALAGAVRTGRTPINVEVNPGADFFRYRSEEDYPFRRGLDQWTTYLEEQHPGLDITIDVVSGLEEPFSIPTLVSGEEVSAVVKKLAFPKTEEVFWDELIKTAQVSKLDTTWLYMAYTAVTDRIPKSLTQLQVDVMDDPSLAASMASWLSSYRGIPVVDDDIVESLDIKEYMELVPKLEPETELEEIEQPPTLRPPESFEPLSEEEIQEEYNNLMGRLPGILDMLAGELSRAKKRYTGLQVYVSPSLHGAMGDQLLQDIVDLSYSRGIRSFRDLNIEVLIKEPRHLEDERERTVPVFHFTETPFWEEAPQKEKFDSDLTMQLMRDALIAAEMWTRDDPTGAIHFYIHPELLQDVGEDEIHRLVEVTLDPSLASKTTFILDENVPEKGFDVIPWHPGLSSEPGRILHPPGEKTLRTTSPAEEVIEPTEFPLEVSREFLKTRQNYDTEMEHALEQAIFDLTTERYLFGTDARALFERGRRRSRIIPDELRNLFFDQGIEVAKDTMMWPVGVRDLMLTGEEQSYYLKVNPEGWADAFVLFSDFRDKDNIDDLRDGVNAASSFLKTYPDAAPNVIRDYWETKIQPNKPDEFCTGWATTMQMYGVPLTRNVNVSDPDKPEIRRSNGRADAIGYIEGLLAGSERQIKYDVVINHLEDVMRGGNLKVSDPYVQGWFEGLNQEGFPPSLLGYPGVLQKEVPPVPTSREPVEISEELWNFRQNFIDQAKAMGLSDEWILSNVGDPESLQRVYERHLSRQRVSAFKVAQNEGILPGAIVKEDLTELIQDLLSESKEVPSVPKTLPTIPPTKEQVLEFPEEVTSEIEDEYNRLVSTLRGLDQENLTGVYIQATPTLYAFIGGTSGMQGDLLDEGWSEEAVKRVFLVLASDLGVDLLSTMSIVTSPTYEETVLLPQPGFRYKDSGYIWDGNRWLVPDEQVYELWDLRFRLLNKEPFGTEELWFPVEVTYAPEKSGMKIGREYTMPISWLQEAVPVSSSTPTEEELATQLWERSM
jgi:hypothetical protein